MVNHSEARPLVLVGVDGTKDGVRALGYAVAEALRRDARLRVVHVEEQVAIVIGMMPVVPDPRLHEIASGVVKEAEEQARDLGYEGPELEAVLSTGPRNRALLEHAEEATCVILGRHSTHLEHLMTGSTTAALAAHAHVPVVSVPNAWSPISPVGPVVVGLHDTSGATPLLDAAFEEARSRDTTVKIVHAWRPKSVYDAAIGSRALADEWARSTRASLTGWVQDHYPDPGVEWAVTPYYDRPVAALHEASFAAGLLVLGRRGQGGVLSRPLGSTTRALLHTSACPVMVVPPPSTSDGGS